jgi:hypothetical protein
MSHVPLPPRVMLLVALMSVLVLGSAATTAVAAGDPDGLVPRSAPERTALGPSIAMGAASQTRGAVLITGGNFTPGGKVYLALTDQEGRRLVETRWVTASLPTYHAVSEVVDHTGGGTISERFGTSVAPISGPNGIQDPATGYEAVTAADSLCGVTTRVQAYDQGTAAWSNLLDLDLGC